LRTQGGGGILQCINSVVLEIMFPGEYTHRKNEPMKLRSQIRMSRYHLFIACFQHLQIHLRINP